MNAKPYLFGSLDHFPKTTLMGEVNVAAPNKHFKRTSKEWILYAVCEGTMKIQEEDRQYQLSSGDILVLSPGKCHFGLPVNHSVRYYYIHFQWDSLQELLLTYAQYQKKKIEIQEKALIRLDDTVERDFLILPKYFHLSQSVFDDILTDIQHLIRNSGRAIPHQQSLNHCLFYMLLLKLSRCEWNHSVPNSPNLFSSALPIIAYLKEHHKEKITSLALEQEFHHNFDYMNRKFKATTGMTIFNFLEKYRIEESKKLLESKQYSITEIAESLGFCNAFYFSKVFKKHENMSPSKYKKLY